MNIQITTADYQNPQHRAAIPQLLDAYAQDPMGGGNPLPESVKENLVSELAARPYAFSILAFADGTPVGLTNCFESFSSFYCSPLINIHDIAVLNTHRRKGIAQRMLAKIEEIARNRGSCKITLEVLSNNHNAKAAYQKFGFSDYQLDPNAGSALFWQKILQPKP